MSGENNVCVDCRKVYSFSTAEKARFDNLMKTVQGFQMPKRCFECRSARRNGEARPAPPAPAPVQAKPPQAAPPKKGEIRLVLATTDFENLIAGKQVVWQGVTVILADIGFKAMHDAIDRVEQEKFDAKFNR
jgi:hypothetical protein